MSCASHDSSQCRRPASGATTARATSSQPKGSPRLSARTTSALTTPTPISATTRATPRRNVTVSCPRYGRDHAQEDRDDLAPAQALGLHDALGHRRFCRRLHGGTGSAVAVRGGGHRGVVDDEVGGPRAVLRLPRHEAVVGPAPGHQLGVPSALRHAPVFERDDAVGPDHAGEAVGEDQGGAALHQPIERFLDDRFALGVHRRQRLVEDEDGRVAQKGAGDGDALALAARQAHPALAHDVS